MKKLMKYFLLILMLFTACTGEMVNIEHAYGEVKIESQTDSIIVGDELPLTLVSEDGRNLNDVTWTISDESILSSRSLTGSSMTVSAEKPGKATVTALDGLSGKSASVIIEVKSRPVLMRPLEPAIPIPPDITGSYSFIVNGDVLDRDSGEPRPFQDLDRLLLEVTDKEGKRSFNILAASESGKWWLYDEEGRRNAEIDGSRISSVKAYYAPSFEIRDGEIRRKQDFHGRVGRLYNGENEFMMSEGVIDRKKGSITFDFERPYSLLTIETRPNTRVRVNIRNFVSAEGDTAENHYSETILTGDGRISIYGNWNEESEIQIIYAQYGKLHEVRGRIPEFSRDRGSIIQIDLPEPPIRIERPYLQAETFMDMDLRDYIYYFPGQIDQGAFHLCWAASSSFMLNWWTWQNSKEADGMLKPSVPENPMDNKDIYSYSDRTYSIFRVFMDNFLDRGFDPILAMRWFLSGEVTPVTRGNLKSGSSHEGFFSDDAYITDLVWDFEENYENPIETDDEKLLLERYENVSKEIYGILSEGNPIVVQNHNHAFNIWAAGFDTEKELVTDLWISNSNGSYIENHNPYGIGHVSISAENGQIVLNMVHEDDGNGTVHAPDDDPLRTFATIIRNYGDIRYITED